MQKYTTAKEIKDLYQSHFLIEDTTIIDAILAIALASKMPGDSIWMFLVGAPSSGKTELINILSKVSFCHFVSTLTENTFLSSMKAAPGKETSLLRKIGNKGMIVMKDYTTLMSMRADRRDSIIAQMREVFDGNFTKMSGNGNDEKWTGKINWVGCVTDVIHAFGGESAAMGRRALMFELPPFDDEQRINMGRTANKNLLVIESIRIELQDAVADFIRYKQEKMDALPILTKDMEEDILMISNFVTTARTGVDRNFRGELLGVFEREGLVRFNSQVTKLLQTMMAVSDKTEMDEEYRRFAFKVGMDSIPKRRRQVLYALAAYREATKKGIATLVGLPTVTVGDVMEELNALRIIDRRPNPSIGADIWTIKENYRLVIQRYAGVEMNEDVSILDDTSEGELNTLVPDTLSRKIGGYVDDIGELQEQKEFSQRDSEVFEHELAKQSIAMSLKKELSQVDHELANLDTNPFLASQTELKRKLLIKHREELTAKLNSLPIPQSQKDSVIF